MMSKTDEEIKYGWQDPKHKWKLVGGFRDPFRSADIAPSPFWRTEICPLPMRRVRRIQDGPGGKGYGFLSHADVRRRREVNSFDLKNYSLGMNGTGVFTDEASNMMWEGMFKPGSLYMGFHSGPPSLENEFGKRIEIRRDDVEIRDGRLYFLCLPEFKNLPPRTYGGFWDSQNEGALLFSVDLN